LFGAQVGLHLFNARELVGQFLNRADFGLLVDRDVASRMWASARSRWARTMASMPCWCNPARRLTSAV
jgi:hypothetical protein